ncbi:hypothetical protein P3485_22155 [Vibrio parahaemolyticus]|uniref:hypothetical protein n=1 Tax=Vibrio parahaemolyticus TaxID=670 RepID=UPI002362EC40|nr:hypothetical protein [Vibrio parahaemolyticus]MDF4518501.1 hypothetical protein [Vibrio parahaemolyticus]MDF4522965.1 hypothetical protein [Vibrio parahaemolyticus]MDF4540987.1 hypothetical protein [Vibrio parahaemolyticus]MDF4550137.1 hypothetical protein [Vibrio parahaemolyticus]
MDFLSNEWVVGIGGGILSGLIVTLLTRYIFTKRDNREYYRKLDLVNKEVLYALRPGISEGAMPNESVLESLIIATSRKYKVNSKDIFQPKQIAEELIKEIMDSSFISFEAKSQYCSSLSHLVEDVRPRSEVEESEEKRLNKHYQIKQNQQMSVVLGLFTGATSVVVTIMSMNMKIDETSSLITKVYMTTFPMMLAASAALVSIAGIFAYLRLRKVRRTIEQQT